MSSNAPRWLRRAWPPVKRFLLLAERNAFAVGLVISFAWTLGTSANRGDGQTAVYSLAFVSLLIGLIRSRERCYRLQKTNDELMDLLRYGREAALQRGILRPATVARLIRHAARVLDNNSPKGPAK